MHLSSAREAKIRFQADLARTAAATKPLEDQDILATTAIAVGISPRPRGGFALALRAQTASEPLRRVTADWRERLGDDIDTRVIGRVRKQSVPWHRQRVRPVVPGVSVSHERVTAGTIGGFVRRAAGGAVELLSNNHVLANENGASLGDPILQPGAHDGGTSPDDIIGSLAAFVPIDPAATNLVDCAVSALDDEVAWSLETFKLYGGLTGVFDLNADEPSDFPTVAKFGRTSGHTRGTITAIEVDDVGVEYDLGVVRFDGQIEVEGFADQAFSEGGDSGSLVVTADESGAEAVGLLFAGSETGGANGRGLTYLNPIDVVLTALQAQLLLEEGGA